jgi:hypothetical protein
MYAVHGSRFFRRLSISAARRKRYFTYFYSIHRIWRLYVERIKSRIKWRLIQGRFRDNSGSKYNLRRNLMTDPQNQPAIDRKARMKIPYEGPPARPVAERLKDFRETLTPLSPERAMREAGRCLQCPMAPCVKACPVGNDIPRCAFKNRTGGFPRCGENLPPNFDHAPGLRPDLPTRTTLRMCLHPQ